MNKKMFKRSRKSVSSKRRRCKSLLGKKIRINANKTQVRKRHPSYK